MDHGTHVEARLQNWRLLKPGDKYLKREDGNMKMVEKVENGWSMTEKTDRRSWTNWKVDDAALRLHEYDGNSLVAWQHSISARFRATWRS